MIIAAEYGGKDSGSGSLPRTSPNWIKVSESGPTIELVKALLPPSPCLATDTVGRIFGRTCTFNADAANLFIEINTNKHLPHLANFLTHLYGTLDIYLHSSYAP